MVWRLVVSCPGPENLLQQLTLLDFIRITAMEIDFWMSLAGNREHKKSIGNLSLDDFQNFLHS